MLAIFVIEWREENKRGSLDGFPQLNLPRNANGCREAEALERIHQDVVAVMFRIEHVKETGLLPLVGRNIN
jgi:hypothetical protein